MSFGFRVKKCYAVDYRGGKGGVEHNPQARAYDGGDAQQAFVPDGCAPGDGNPSHLPGSILQARLPAVDMEGCHALPQRNVFLQHDDIKCIGIWHADVEGVVRARCGPVCMIGCVQHVVGLVSAQMVAVGMAPVGNIIRENTVALATEFHQTQGVFGADAAVGVRRHVEKQ